MAEDFAIKVENLNKSFKLPREKVSSIKGAAVNFYKRTKSYEIQEALNDVSFEIKKGEFFGIVGRNGSGKSTLLKILAGIYTPTKGQVHVRGKLTPFIELGVGFNPELTGRENVYLNGALLGFNRKDMAQMYDDIVRFAELERFMDQKLKNYSSGMQVRLAFSIAIRVKSDILLIDEVLAVGDAAFQQKCFDYFDKLKRDDTTIILVTHDMSAINRFCDRSMMIDNGKVVDVGSPQKIAASYLQANEAEVNEQLRTQNIKKHKIHEYKAKVELNQTTFNSGETANLAISWPSDLDGVKNIGVAIYTSSGSYVFGPNTVLEKYRLKSNQVNYEVKLDIGPGSYYFKVGLFGENTTKIVEFVDDGPQFIIREGSVKWEGITYLDHKWIS